MNKMTVHDVDFAGKRVLVRVDFNVPIRDGGVGDATRIRAAVPTLQHILAQKPQHLVLMSHLGRPKGERKPNMSLAPVVPVLAEMLGVDVAFADDCIGETATSAIAALPEGGVILLENTRYHKGETKNDPDFAAELAQHGEIFVNDAFGTAHRAHASNVGVSEKMTAVAGLLLQKEIDYLSNAIENPAQPFVAILGGAKVSDKIQVIEALLGKVDKLLIGGGMANTFNAAQGIDMQKSLVEREALDRARQLLSDAGDKLLFPTDGVAAAAFDNDAEHRVYTMSEGVPEGWQSLDIGPQSITAYRDALQGAQTVVWNGPMGVFEMSNFANGTFEIARLLADMSDQGATTIVGGGDSASAVEKAGLADRITHVSTGGGASLEMLEGKTLPGLAALNDK